MLAGWLADWLVSLKMGALKEPTCGSQDQANWLHEGITLCVVNMAMPCRLLGVALLGTERLLDTVGQNPLYSFSPFNAVGWLGRRVCAAKLGST